MLELTVHHVDTVPAVDGEPRDAVWNLADTVRVHTVRGANHDNGEVTVDVKAVHDGEFVYALFRWRDDTRSQKHLPLVKTADGWVVQQTTATMCGRSRLRFFSYLSNDELMPAGGVAGRFVEVSLPRVGRRRPSFVEKVLWIDPR